MNNLLLQKYLTNTASEKELVEVLDWLDASADNRKYLDSLDYVSNAALLLTPLGDKRQTLGKAPRLSWRNIVKWSSGIAASLLLCGALSHFLAYNTIKHHADQLMCITAPQGHNMAITLSDGTQVHLNAGAKLEYPAIFFGSHRNVRIEGEAMFDVHHDPEHPFVVETYACKAEVLGTKFNIIADEANSCFTASLLEGSLRISTKDNGTHRESVVLRPNQQVKMVDGHLHLDRITDSDDLRWIEGLMNLNGLTFREIIAKFQNYYGIPIVIEDSLHASGSRYHGKIRVSDGIDRALSQLQLLSDFAYSRDEVRNTIHIYKNK